MKDSKAVYVTLQDIKGNPKREYEINTNRVANESDYLEKSCESGKDFYCQYDGKRDTIVCTCKRTNRRESRYFGTSRQIYRSQRYSSAKGFKEVGVGSIKILAKKRARRIYLPVTKDRGVGSSDLTTFIQRTRNFTNSYYDQKKTSSKCVGGVMEHRNTSVLSEKLSPIYHTKSESTSPKGASFVENQYIDDQKAPHSINVYSVEDKENVQVVKVSKQYEGVTIAQHSPRNAIQTDKTSDISLPTTNKINPTITPFVNDENIVSSDSLVHVHNLENPSKTSIDLIQDKLDRECIKFFTTKSKECKPRAEVKPMQDFKSSSVLRRHFEALRRGFSKKENSNNNCDVTRTSSQSSVPSKKNVSIASDPPSLEARSYMNTKVLSPTPPALHQCKNLPQTSYTNNVTDKNGSSNWSIDVVESDYQNVKGMFKLWGKKFNLEEECYKKPLPNISPDSSKKRKKKVELILPKENVIEKEKREGKRFSFFKRKVKNKSKELYKTKKGVTAGRCEVGDGLMIKIGAANEFSPELRVKNTELSDDYDNDNILRKAWLQRFLANKRDSHNSVQIRWNNNMYATSSSTVFELMECVYKNTGIVFRSKSEVPSEESSYYHSHKKPRVNFRQRHIEAWMIPRMFTDVKSGKHVNIPNTKKEKKKNIEVSFSNQKWFIDKSKAFPQKIEIVLHSKNVVKSNKTKSLDYIMIDIPQGYFCDTSEDEVRSQTSDEQVYNIVEYDTPNSGSYLNNRKIDHKMDICDHVTVNVKVGEENEKKSETVIKKPPLYRDVVVQGSNVYLPKKCDVIGVGIITQRDIRNIKKPILKLQYDITDDESTHTIAPQKKCELAESYLQDYYRQWTPLGLELFSWCVSDSHLRGSSDISLNSFNNQGDGSKSCPNIYDDYHASTIVSSCTTSSCSHCMAIEEETKLEDSKKTTFFNKFKKKPVDPLAPVTDGKRVLPKDSLEVFKRRKIYASSNKSNWGVNVDRSEPYSVPSSEDNGAQNTATVCPKTIKPCCKPAMPKSKKKCKKHVSLQDCDVMNELLREQLSDKMVEGILSFKGASGCDTCKKQEPESARHARVIPIPTCEMPQPPCIDSCTEQKKPPCSKKDSPPCHVPSSPPCPVGMPSPCQPKPCPPIPTPCAMVPPCLRTSPPSTPRSPPRTCRVIPKINKSPPPASSPTLCSRPPPRTKSPCVNPKPIPPRLHSPRLTAQRLPCACVRKNSPCGLPQCPSVRKPKCAQDPPPFCEMPSNEKPKKYSSQEYPWPLKNQRSNTPSPHHSGTSLGISSKDSSSDNSLNKYTDAFKHLIQKLSNSSIAKMCSNPKQSNSSTKECRPDCANKIKEMKPPRLPRPQPTATTKSQPKITGLHLKKMPMPRNSSDDCKKCCTEGIIKLNSKENITIRMKQQTPSTEEIRESCNIKVQDEDGQTLYERRDYHIDKARTHLVKGMYKDSQIQRVSTSNVEMIKSEKNLDTSESTTSVSNIIEINLNLKLKQGDKTTDVNIKNSDLPKQIQNKKVHTLNSSNEVYLVQDKGQQSMEDIDKKDVNIKIIIKGFQQSTNKIKRLEKKCTALDADEEFSKKISEKFHTVSTGYNDIFEQQTYLVQRTKSNLTNSDENRKTGKKLANEELMQEHLTNHESIAQHSAFECSVNLTPTSHIENEMRKQLPSNISSSKVNIPSLKNAVEFSADAKSAKGVSITDNEAFSDVKERKAKVNKMYTKEHKKNLLKQIFENSNATKKTPNKGKMRSIRQMLRAALTSDSSACEDVLVSNELGNELTYASLKPNYFKDSDSMTNYYGNNSSISLYEPSKHTLDEILYPTEQNNSDNSQESDINENVGCLCSHLAAKLNVHENSNVRPCCCSGIGKKDEEIGCNITEDLLILNKTEHIDVETQNSKYFSSQKTESKTVVEQTEVANEKLYKYVNRSPTNIFSYSSTIKTCALKKINRQTVLGLSDDDKVIVLNSNSGHSRPQIKEMYRNKRIKPIDVLQLHETKKAVLEIYAEKTVSDNDHIVAKLPKFLYNKESEICNHQETIAGFHRRRNFVMMSITR